MTEAINGAESLPTKLQNARPTKVVRVPWGVGREANEPNEVRIRPLTLDEQMSAALAANVFVEGLMKGAKKGDPAHTRMFADAFRIEVLFRACRSSNDPKQPLSFKSATGEPLAVTPRNIRSWFNADELDALFRHYLTVCDELGPFRDDMPDDELAELAARLASDGSAYSCDLLTNEQKNVLLLYMAYRLAALTDETETAKLAAEQ